MEKSDLYRVVRNSLLPALAKTGEKSVPVSICSIHVHLCREDVVKLFGYGYQLRPSSQCSQPGQYEAVEKVTLIGVKGTIPDVCIIGPEREQTQVELSISDASALGVKAVFHMSGDLNGTPGIKIEGPKGIIQLHRGVIIPARHLHLSSEEASSYGLRDGDKVRIRKTGEFDVAYDNIVVRAGQGHSLDVHLNAGEGSAANITTGEILEIV